MSPLFLKMNSLIFNFDNDDIFYANVELDVDIEKRSVNPDDSFDKYVELFLEMLDKSLVNNYRVSKNKIEFYKSTMEAIREIIDDFLYLNLYNISTKEGTKRKTEINDICIYDNKCLIKTKNINFLLISNCN